MATSRLIVSLLMAAFVAPAVHAQQARSYEFLRLAKDLVVTQPQAGGGGSPSVPVEPPPPPTAPATAQGALTGTTSFGTLYIGQPVSITYTFANTGTAPANNVIATVTGTGLSRTSGTCGTTGAPNTVAAGATCSVTLRWNPTTAFTLSGQLSVSSTAVNSPSGLALTGVSQVDTAFYAAGKTFEYAGDFNYANALSTCSASTARGYSDWRVPTLAELNSLVSVVGGYAGLSGRGWPTTNDPCYWSTDAYNTNYQQGRTLASGNSCTINKTFVYKTTCVR